ncbi:MAG: YggT family protein [Tahibacter sp.]
MGFLTDVGSMLVQLIGGLLLSVLALRVVLPLVALRFSNPLCQIIYKFTNPVISPLARLLPTWRKLSLAAVLLLCLVALLEIVILLSLAGFPLQAPQIVLSTLGSLVYFMLGAAFWAVVIRALMSWFSVDYGNPAVEVLFAITDPVLRPFRKLPPRNVGFDLSPLYAGFVLRICMRLIEHLMAGNGILILQL